MREPLRSRAPATARRRATRAALLACGAWFLVLLLDRCLPPPLERLREWPSSPQLVDREGRVLAARVGSDDQWRFPVGLDGAGPWLPMATVAVEDERFLRHCGVDPLAVVRALGSDLSAGRVVSGASTLTMQLARMLEPRRRTWDAKLLQAARALQLEARLDKTQLLEAYLDTAPYGGNLRGVEAGARRWFGKHARDLSLAEAALLAGLPQSPERLRPDRFAEAARRRRDHVLDRMWELGMLPEDLYRKALGTPVRVLRRAALSTGPDPEALAPHLVELALAQRPAGGRLTLDPELQARVLRRAREHLAGLPPGLDAAVVVLDLEGGQLRAHVGGLHPADPDHGQLDLARARRSPGSALKPFVYGAAFEARRLTPGELLLDAPLERDGWRPENFDPGFAGELPAAEALRRSLNVPAVLALERAGVERTAAVLEAVGIGLAPGAARRAGLSLALGGAEVRLLDLTDAWATLARHGRRVRPRLFVDAPREEQQALRPDTCRDLLAILHSDLRRPNGLHAGEDAPDLAWKTGTSAGHRDAWAVGASATHAIGVWVGRPSGAGDPDLVGARAAEPLLVRLARDLELAARP